MIPGHGARLQGGRVTAADKLPRWGETLPTLVAIAVAVVLPRLLVLDLSVIDWDESAYALVAQQWLAGHVPHETVFDHKPAGLFAVFALFMLVFGDTLLAIRMIPIVFVAATAALLARIAYVTLDRDRWMAGLAAALYGLLTLANGGLASNTELLVNLFIVAAICLLLAFRLDLRVSPAGGLCAGASLGLAFQINFLGGVLVAGVAASYLAWMWASGPFRAIAARYLANGVWMFVGFLAAGVLVTLPVALFGDLADYFGLKLAYLGDYRGVENAAVVVRRVSEALLPYWPFYVIAAALGMAVLARPSASRQEWCSPASPRDRRIVAWLVLGLFSVLAALASRRFYHHFFLFTLPPLVLLSVSFLRLATIPEGPRRFLAISLLLCGLAAPVSAQGEFLRGIRAFMKATTGMPADAVAGSARYMSGQLRPGETIYVFDGQPILYFLTRTTPPTRFAFPESHLREDVALRLGTTPVESVQQILERKPRFVVAQPGPSGLGVTAAGILLKDALDRDYLPARVVDPSAPDHVYERADATAIPRQPR